ncbi:hypothetical protein [Arthrobacter psychrolactophilus]|uniref:hypothetical protein n=1 Tax=Arthrobacter psychrolactophilus TaxID=92442 RepID=UPI0015E89292|nr:hypothetical protein [Arthrobacter psychrolactophilus]
MGWIILLLVIGLALAVLGFILKGLIWLAVIGIVLFVVAGVLGWSWRRGFIRS